MKLVLISLLFIFISSFLVAQSTDEVIASAVAEGYFTTFDGSWYFLDSSCKEDWFMNERSAQLFIVKTAYIFLGIQKGWFEYTVTSDTDVIESVEYIGAAVTLNGTNCYIYFPMSSAKEGISADDYHNKSFEEVGNMLTDLYSTDSIVRTAE